ncbi:unnamed protein product [Eruca vesicaria subsp. sativa]|uniref:Uncharacterized protein n=1 Tax=Eruca vesicaria subsp. sativa TaxID=29727 RepID=A0ABC8KRJ2_ERUVS|nr:unnamed protein product [Eruca vesicaria subsp. sativa]
MTKKKLNNPLEDPPMASSSDEDEVEVLSGDDEEEEEEISNDLMNPVNIRSKSEKPIIAVTKPKAKRPMETTSVNAKRAKIGEETTTKKASLFQRLWSEEDEISVLQGMIDFKADTGKSPYEDMHSFYKLTSKSISFEPSKIQFVDKIRSLRRKYMGKVKQGAESLTKPHDIQCLKLAKYIWGSHGLALDSNVKKQLGKEEDEEVVTPKSAAKFNGTPKKSAKKPISVEANGDNGGEDREVLITGEKGEEDREVLVNGKKVDEDKDVLASGDDGSEEREVFAGGEKVAEDKEVLINGGGASKSHVVRASDWFEDSFLVGSIAGLGVGEQFVKQKWSMVTAETKKRMEEKWKLLQAKEMELVLHKTDFMREIGSVIAEAS